ncbi:MAG TPA: hypothetical protein VLX92_11800, partial [Kofleriaceae bacterium]|nr:hypothetical protein [Kofleriaceae bacterium]
MRTGLLALLVCGYGVGSASPPHVAIDFHGAFDSKILIDVGKPVAVHKVVAGELVVRSGRLSAFD